MRAMADTRKGRREIRRILLIVDYCHTGDALRIASAVTAVRSRFPNAAIVLVANEHTLPVFEGMGVCDRVVLSRLYEAPPARRWKARLWQAGEWLRLAWRLGTGYDLVITFWWGTPPLHLLGLVAGPFAQRLGYTRKLPWLLTCRLGMLPGEDPAAEHAAILRLAGVDVERTPPSMHYSDADDAAAARMLAAHGLEGARPIVVLHPGSDWACQQWVTARWAALAESIAACFGADIVWTGLAGEAALIERIQRQMLVASVSLAGRTSLAQLAAVLARARLCVCVDSAVYELTQAVGAPAVVLAGPTSPEHVVPGIRLPVIVNPLDAQQRHAIDDCRLMHDADGGCLNHQCPMAGLRQISVAQVLQAVARQAHTAGLNAPLVEGVQS